ncbi:MAG: hypothetical protein KF774_07895 [Planctomyces sp.]|nr:hypothetical protein [Planctomyces sp.]
MTPPPRPNTGRTPFTTRSVSLLLAIAAWFTTAAARGEDHRLLYVATPGIRNYLEYGGHGLLVFDIDDGHRFLRRIPLAGLDDQGQPRNVKGICANAETRRIYVSTTHTLQCLDLTTDELLWERAYDGGCDRMSMSPDGAAIYLPSLERDHWHVVSGDTGDVLAVITPNSGAHNTVFGPDGRWCYLAGLRSPLLTVADAARHQADHTVGPFSAPIRPFTVNGRQTRVYVTVNDLLGFEIGDLETRKMIARVEIPGFSKGPVKRHGCPSHGIGLTPDETQIWVCDAHNQRMHVFDALAAPPTLIESIPVRDEPGWITFSIDGQYAYPSSGEVIDVATRHTAALLTDEESRAVGSEKLLEIDFRNGVPVRAGDQFGIGRVR